MKMKQCTKCKKRKPLSAFWKHPECKNGLHPRCKICISRYRQTRKTKRSKCRKQYRKTLVGCLRERFYHVKHRCNNPKNAGYKNYGGRGIKCLFESADEFVDYVINELQIDPHGLLIDRINNNGHYEKGNIRFVTQAESNRNRKR